MTVVADEPVTPPAPAVDPLSDHVQAGRELAEALEVLAAVLASPAAQEVVAVAGKLKAALAALSQAKW
jgi:hypothetical protein